MASIVRKNLLAPRHALAASHATLVLESGQSMEAVHRDVCWLDQYGGRPEPDRQRI